MRASHAVLTAGRRVAALWTAAIAATTLMAVPVVGSAQCGRWLEGTGVPDVDGFFGGAADELVTWDPDGAGPLGPWLTAVGRIEVAARTAVTTWRALGWGMPDEVNGLTVHQGLLYATGEFYSAGSVQAQHIAKWNGTEWSAVGSGVGMTPSSTIAPEGYAMLSDGTNLYLGGSFGSIDGVVAGSIARWDGSAWHAVSGMHAGRIHALAKYGDEIAMGGIIGSADSKPARGLVFYGPAGWRTIPAEDWLSGPGYSVTTWNDKLVVGGALSGAGDTPARGIAAWDGSEWQSLGDGVGIPPPLGMTEYMGDLIVVGNLTSAGDATVSGVARWDGTTASCTRPEAFHGPCSASGAGMDRTGRRSAAASPAIRCARWSNTTAS